MIFDPKSSALYSDNGEFLKTIACPMALRVKDLARLPDSDGDRHCAACNSRVVCIDDSTDSEVRKLVADRDVCVFATEAARNIVVLQRVGASQSLGEYPKIQTARSLESMKRAQGNGYCLVIHNTGSHSDVGSKCKVYQRKVDGELLVFGDYRGSLPTSEGDWVLVADWFRHHPDMPFPLAAYLVPRGLPRGQRVIIEDVIQQIGAQFWNQGDSEPILTCEAVWNGEDFDLDVSGDDFPDIVG